MEPMYLDKNCDELREIIQGRDKEIDVLYEALEEMQHYNGRTCSEVIDIARKRITGTV